MKFSDFGNKFAEHCGIRQLMDDLGEAMLHGHEVMMLGGGNPAYIPEVQQYFRQAMVDILQQGDHFEHLIGDYDAPQGNADFVQALVTLFNSTYGWDLHPGNIAICNGSQHAFFLLFNLFGGLRQGQNRRILLPMTPEYIGYSDQGLSEQLFTARKPTISYGEERFFKYHIDPSQLNVGPDTAAICVSRPTNPTGNVLTNEEILILSELAKKHSLPLIIDNAYGMPFPSIIFNDVTPVWEPHIVLSMSLSKLGLPGVRTGIIIANETIINAITNLNAVLALSIGSFGPTLTCNAISSGEILKLSQQVIRPFYQQRAEQAVSWVDEAMTGYPCQIHQPEGAIFLWLWFPELPISSQTLYERLKQRNVLVIPGHHFFPGLEQNWPHQHECIRITYSQDPQIVKAGIGIISEEIKRAYDEVSADSPSRRSL